MSLQMIAGPAGSGKSTLAYKELIEAAAEHPRQHFILIVPDQFSMSTTARICNMHPAHGIMNIEVLSFSRLVHRIGDEVGGAKREILDDTGKNLILRRVSLSLEDQLTFLKGRMRRPGYLNEVKSQLSEFYQYDLSEQALSELIEKSKRQGYLAQKLTDLKLLYTAFSDYIKDKYITSEEALATLAEQIKSSSLLAGSVVLLDNFTGFTPIQERVLCALFSVCEKVSVILCADKDPAQGVDRLFALSKKTYDRLVRLAKSTGTEVLPTRFVGHAETGRYAHSPELAFLEQKLLRFSEEVYAGEVNAISIYEAPSRQDEVKRCCRRIEELIREGYAYREIAIETGDLEGYAPLLRAELSRFGIPFYLDQTRSVLQNPAVSLLRFALKCIADRFSRESVMGFLRSGMTDLTTDEIDRLELYLQKTGIRGKSAFLAPFTRGEEAEQIEPIRASLMRQLQPLLSPGKTAKEITKALYELCLTEQLREKCQSAAADFAAQGMPSRAKEYEKIYAKLMDLLDQIYELIGDDVIDLKEYLAVFEAGVSEIRIGTIPQKVDQVMVGDIQRTRLAGVKALLFLGINEGIIPARNAGGGLLSDMEREFLLESGAELAPGPKEKLFEQRLYLYQNMTKPADRLCLSYALLDSAGKGLSPSYLIRHVKGLYPQLRIEGEPADPLRGVATREDGYGEMAALLGKYAQRLFAKEQEDKARAALLAFSAAYGEERVALDLKNAACYVYKPHPLSKEALAVFSGGSGTISRLEQMAACPFAYLVRYGMGLREREDFAFDARDFGNLYHAVLERLLQNLREEGSSITELSDAELTKRIHLYLEEASNGYGYDILRSSARNRYKTKQMEQVLARSASVLRHQLGQGSFSPLFLEYEFRKEGSFTFSGIIDRVDVAKDAHTAYVKVLDYKSGSKNLDFSELFYGVSLQLPIYMNEALLQVGKVFPDAKALPAAMLYFTLKNPILRDVKEEAVESELRNQMRPQGLVLADDEVLRLLDADFPASGKSDVICVAKKRDNNFTAASQVASFREMEACIQYAVRKAGDLMEQIGKGAFAVSPFTIDKDKFDSCSYCRYASVCGFDARVAGYEKKDLPALDQTAFMEKVIDEDQS